MRLMIFGAGYSGKAIGKLLGSEGVSVAGTTRSAEKGKALEEIGIRPFVFDGASLSEPLRAELLETTHLVQSIAPGSEGDVHPLMLSPPHFTT